ncbi:tetratricopeptide repeat protein [Nostoc sp. FACHB-280]|uniref:tetratricopeptide repeat protein n=1 Tax=Nostoc sp. FACHB-280 TaxID=2692839 RepID=UPI00168BC50B|nr:tetratricopeptide repeat protein [Nostoc sp. FACHB-280]MBD2496516.1 tetratricopeptide repeat protein [Nostoc sp. FACHB-280]
MPEDFKKLSDKIGQVIFPGGKGVIKNLVIEGQKQLTPTKHIPRGSVHFVGRETELTQAHEDLQRGNYVAISGMGGVGKTELATQYARQYQNNYGGITWFNDRASNLAAEVLSFFVQLGLEIPQEQGGRLLTLKEQVAWCWLQYPQADLPILIVFDDVTSLDNLREVVPSDNRFRVLVTTRLRNLDANFIQEIPLDVLSPQKEPGKALELLKRLLGNQDKRVDNQPEAANAICECLEYLPLGIELVGAYLAEDPNLHLNIMWERLQQRKLAEAALQDRETLNSTQLGVKAAFALTWEELNRYPLTQQLGKFLSLFAPQSILWNLVMWVATGGGDKTRQLTWTEDEINEAKKQLYKRHLLQQVEDSQGFYKIHALVRWFLQEQLAESSEMKSVLEATFATGMTTIAQKIPQSATSKDIERIRDVAPHLEDLGNRVIAEINQAKEEQIISLASVPKDKIPWIFTGVARFYEGKGLYQLAESWYDLCLKIGKVLFVSDHLYTAGSLNNLAEFYKNQGRYSEAEPLLIDALAMIKRLFIDDHLHVATYLNNLAKLYKNQGRYSEAEPLLIDALAMIKRLFIDDHPHVATILNNLAGLYQDQGRYSEAEPLLIEDLAMTKRLFIGDHPDLATSLNSLAELYKKQGRYSEAEPLYIHSLAMEERLFMGDHPNLAYSLNNLAALYCMQGRYSKAEPLYIHALAMRKRLFPDDHPDVATSLNDLAVLYKQQGRYSEAEPLYIEALTMAKRLFMGYHPKVTAILTNLATFYRDQRLYSEAEPLYIEALTMAKRLFLGDHDNVAVILRHLAILYHKQKQYSKAEPLYVEALEMTKRLFTGDHPDVASSLSNLAELYNSQGRYSQAEPLLIEALAMSQRVLGDNHPLTVTVQQNLAILQRQLILVPIWQRWLGWFFQLLLGILILPFYLLWQLAKKIIKLIRNS